MAPQARTRSVLVRALALPELTLASRLFVERLLAGCPDVAPRLAMESATQEGPFEMLLTLPSPTGDRAREVRLWMENGEPSLGLGSWHTHAGLATRSSNDRLACWDALIALLRAILADQFVLCIDVGGQVPGFEDVLDLREPDALAEKLTDPHSPPRLQLRSWGGTADADVGLSDLQR